MRVSCTDSDIKVAIKKIRAGEIVVFPTDTVYGIGCDPYNKKAILRLYEIKKREKTKLFPVLGLSKTELEKNCRVQYISRKNCRKILARSGYSGLKSKG